MLFILFFPLSVVIESCCCCYLSFLFMMLLSKRVLFGFSSFGLLPVSLTLFFIFFILPKSASSDES